MRPATFAPLATAVLSLPAALLAALPPWALRTVAQVVVIQDRPAPRQHPRQAAKVKMAALTSV